MLTVLLMCNYTEKSPKTINPALTCMKTYLSQENILLNCCRGSKQTANVLYCISRELGFFFHFLNKAVKNHFKYSVFSSYILASPGTHPANYFSKTEISDSIRSASKHSGQKATFSTQYKTVVKLVRYLPLF